MLRKYGELRVSDSLAARTSVQRPSVLIQAARA
jgi:hypothetical protein